MFTLLALYVSLSVRLSSVLLLVHLLRAISSDHLPSGTQTGDRCV